ncbi:glutaredoxin-dependent arsenate reductase [Mizugakiibacter sediminis]|uniref:Arsenate reductase n=1 Tax=Mizugakiibacter sediminis TaxID=1475481 RepID=A0A0K8QQ56_9GAMM|nr:arsenate reductase (glutaredoxin) [Mizugakiibacter sediminis]GAP67008.1 glutaredoxin-dependent arsenate reductase [Mizugakiibacter sediminis]
MGKVRIFHHPRCSKSRATLALLEERGLRPEIVDYLSTPPGAAELSAILDRLGMQPRELMRRDEPEYRELDLDRPTLSRDALIAAMVAHPRLIQRPIVLADGKAAIGRPPEAVLEIL